MTVTRVVLAPDPDRPDGLRRPLVGRPGLLHAGLALAAPTAMVFMPPDADLPAGAEITAWVLRGLDG